MPQAIVSGRLVFMGYTEHGTTLWSDPGVPPMEVFDNSDARAITHEMIFGPATGAAIKSMKPSASKPPDKPKKKKPGELF